MLVIALFYTERLHVALLGAAAGVVVLLLVANRLGVRYPVVYAALGVVLWVFVLRSGVHATIAGRAAGGDDPGARAPGRAGFVARAREIVDRFERTVVKDPTWASRTTTRTCGSWSRDRHPGAAAAPGAPAAPLGGVPHRAPLRARQRGRAIAPRAAPMAARRPIILGVVLGLVLGKPVGIRVAAWLVVRLRPRGAARRASRGATCYGVGLLGGIGFTMSLFIAELAPRRPRRSRAAKLGILAASVIAGVGGYLLLRLWATRAGAPTDG